MAHLISPVQNLSLADAEALLRRACSFLVERADAAVAQYRNGETRVRGVSRPDLRWGAHFKRIEVDLTDSGGAVQTDGRKSEKLVEVINLCATLERLLDLLHWLQEHSDFSRWRVELCHPTTSSFKKREEDPESPHEDNDLILVEVEAGGRRAFFEVSDVASAKDGNGKEKKDLTSLGVLKPGAGRNCFVSAWPSGRRFLVVSTEFAQRLRKPTRLWLKAGHCHYSECKPPSTETFVFEVLPGQSSGQCCRADTTRDITGRCASIAPLVGVVHSVQPPCPLS